MPSILSQRLEFVNLHDTDRFITLKIKVRNPTRDVAAAVFPPRMPRLRSLAVKEPGVAAVRFAPTFPNRQLFLGHDGKLAGNQVRLPDRE